MPDARRQVPRTDTVLADPRLAAATSRLGHGLVRDVVTEVLQRVRHGELAPDVAADAAVDRLPESATRLRPTVNATGVIVHTNLGRAPLSAAARDAVLSAAGNTDLEFDLDSGQRASRGESTLAALERLVPAAQKSLVTNNNAAALVLAATALAQDREIIISRGELVEIGDRFRIPDLIESTGARLREVGTTNRTRIDDYTAAIGPDTGFILKVHPSNFHQTGFVSDVPVEELSTLEPPVVYDIGSGLLHPHPRLPREPDTTTALHDGAALVTASGDKLLGGPQAGIVLGRADLIDRLRRHPLARALRVDKLTLAALEATLTGPPTPVRSALDANPDVLLQRARRIATALADNGITATAVPSQACVGGGGAPEVVLPSAAVSLNAELARPLRTGRHRVVGRLHDGRLLLDLRAVPAETDDTLVAAITAAQPG